MIQTRNASQHVENSATIPTPPKPTNPHVYNFIRRVLEASDLIDRRHAERQQTTSEQEDK